MKSRMPRQLTISACFFGESLEHLARQPVARIGALAKMRVLRSKWHPRPGFSLRFNPGYGLQAARDAQSVHIGRVMPVFANTGGGAQLDVGILPRSAAQHA